MNANHDGLNGFAVALFGVFQPSADICHAGASLWLASAAQAT
jgi:hypothetical protein